MGDGAAGDGLAKGYAEGVEAYPLTRPWSRGWLVLFRFVFCYLLLYCLDMLSWDLVRLVYPGHRSTPLLMQVIWGYAIPWIGLHVVHLHQAVAAVQFGGDVVFEYLLRLTELALAVAGAVVWTVIDRRRCDYRLLQAYLRIFVRTMLGSVMIFYGLAKVFPVQFGSLTLHRLMRPVGDLRPMGMLWIFMAASPVYTILSGVVETTGGLLLLFRRTTTLGALISAGAMANVLLLNVLYDVNQKIRCVHYLLLALFLLAPQLPRLWTALMGSATEAVPELVIPANKWGRTIALCLPVLFGLFIFTLQGFHYAMGYKTQKQAEGVRGPYYGVWSVKTFAVADERKPLFSDKLNEEMHLAAGQDHWTRLVFDQGNAVYLQVAGSTDDDLVQARPDAKTGSLVLVDDGDRDWQCQLKFVRIDPDSLEMSGMVNGNGIEATLVRENAQPYHLTDKIRWISDGDRQY